MKDNKIKNFWLGIDRYAYRSDCIVIEIDGNSYDLAINHFSDIYPQILKLDEHDRAVGNELLNRLREFAEADDQIVKNVFGVYTMHNVFTKCTNKEILDAIKRGDYRKAFVKKVLDDNGISMEELKRLLEDEE